MQTLDQSLAIFEVTRLTYEFRALDASPKEEASALRIMRIIEQFARDFRHDVKERSIQFVYGTVTWLMRPSVSDDFVAHQISILMECVPIGLGGLVAKSPKPLARPEQDLLDHSIDVAGEIAYDVCKYVRLKEPAEQAFIMLHNLLRFTDLNDIPRSRQKVMREFDECERICKQRQRRGQAFADGLKLLKSCKETALSPD